MSAAEDSLDPVRGGERAPARGTQTATRFAAYVARLRADIPAVLLDALLIVGAYGGILVLRFDGAVPTRYWSRFWLFVPLAVPVHILSNWAWRLYRQVWQHASVEEARRVALAGATAAAVLTILVFVTEAETPRSVVVLGAFLATILTGAVRFQSRLFAFHRGAERRAGLRLLVIGAGQAGAALVREMLRSPESGLRPVAFLDDDDRKRGRSILGVPILGGIDDLATVSAKLGVHQAVLVVPSGSNEVVRRAHAAASAASVPLRVAPPLTDLIRGRVSIRDIRELRIEDLLGRQQVQIDMESIARVLNGRRVLITGAGGSIGSEIARQVSQFAPEYLAILDHDETHLYDVASSLPSAVQVLADIRDSDELQEVFRRHRPDVVFHAAAHKHVPILEDHACQAVATNVFGTLHVVEAAADAGVQDLVFISTDKAVRPANVMGASKWFGEQLVLSRAPAGTRYCGVRFGNVLGSRGSVIPTFARQIESGGPVTVTDPRMTRFFMSISEAVQLVLQAMAFAKGGEIFMLDMGEPVNILELAKRMIRLSGYSVGSEIPIRITGARCGEKLVEELRAPWEAVEATPHQSIERLQPIRVPRYTLDRAMERLRTASVLHREDDAATVLLTMATRPTTAELDEVLAL